MRVLVCDDNEDAASTLSTVLRLSQHEVVTCHDGRSCLEKAREWMPEVAILDIGMPEFDGYEVARQLRALPGGDRLLLIALTGWGAATDVARASAAGFNVHFTKPAEAVDPRGVFVERRSQLRHGSESRGSIE